MDVADSRCVSTAYTTGYPVEKADLMDLESHLSFGELRHCSQAGRLSDHDSHRLVHHMVAGCRICWGLIEGAQLSGSTLSSAPSPIVAAFRALTTDDLDRLTPLQRLVRRRGRHWHLGFCRLVVEEHLRLIAADPKRTGVIDLSSLLKIASERLPRAQRHDLFALDHIREIEVAVRGSQIDYARKSVVRAMLQYMSGTADPELKATMLSAEARLWWRRGHRSTAIGVLNNAVEALAKGDPDLDERRAEILIERAFYLSLSGRLAKGREVLEEALALLEALASPCPSLKLTVLHNLATTDANLSLVVCGDEDKAEGRTGLAESQARIEVAGDLYERYGTPSLRAQRDALLALGRGEPGRQIPALFRTALGFERSGLPLESAQVAFELLEWLELQGERDAAAVLVEELRQRLADSPAVAGYFEFLTGRVRELTQLADLPKLPGHLLRARLELLELLAHDPAAETTQESLL